MIALAGLRGRKVALIDFLPPDEPIAPAAIDPISSAVIAALGQLEQGVLLLDALGRVHFASATAEELLASRQMRIQAGELRARSVSETAKLQRMVAQSAQSDRGEEKGPVEFLRVGEPALLFQSARLAAPERGGLPQPFVVVVVTDPADDCGPTPAQLRQQFDLTPAEALLASEVVKGGGLKECARAIGIAEATARTHLHRIFEKTGTKRQAQLVRLVMASRFGLRQASGS
jgi:DNA-binding CsgD family transcriptional regulator